MVSFLCLKFEASPLSQDDVNFFSTASWVLRSLPLLHLLHHLWARFSPGELWVVTPKFLSVLELVLFGCMSVVVFSVCEHCSPSCHPQLHQHLTSDLPFICLANSSSWFRSPPRNHLPSKLFLTPSLGQAPLSWGPLAPLSWGPLAPRCALVLSFVREWSKGPFTHPCSSDSAASTHSSSQDAPIRYFFLCFPLLWC